MTAFIVILVVVVLHFVMHVFRGNPGGCRLNTVRPARTLQPAFSNLRMQHQFDRATCRCPSRRDTAAWFLGSCGRATPARSEVVFRALASGLAPETLD